MQLPGKYVLFDIDGTLIDALDNQRGVWSAWALRHGLDPDEVYRTALRTRPVETFAEVAPDRDPRVCLDLLHELEDEDVRTGDYTAFDGAAALLAALPVGSWALVTSNYEHRVRGRFARTGLPVPEVIVDAASVREGKPSPVPYLLAAERLGARPEDCLVIEDAPSGVRAGLRAGMTVWSVNAPAAGSTQAGPAAPVTQPGPHRRFAALGDAVRDILAFAAAAREPADRPCDAVLCDLDNVIRFYDTTHLASLERAAGLPEGTTEDIAYAPATDLPLLLGRISPDEWVEAIVSGLVGRVDEARARELGRALARAPFRADEEVVAMLRRVRARVPLVLVTNATLRLEDDLAALGIGDLADHVVSSAVEGVAKPDPEIYRIAAARAGVPPDRCLVVDDRQENVDAAVALGMTGVLFREPADLHGPFGFALTPAEA